MNTMDDNQIHRLREWTPDGGQVSPYTLISRSAKVRKPSRVLEHAQVLGEAELLGDTVVTNFGKVMDKARVLSSRITEHARIGGYAHIDNSWVEGTSDIRGDAMVLGSVITDNVIITDRARVEQSTIGCNARVLGNAKLYNVYFRKEANGDINNTIIIEGDAQLEFAVPMELRPGTRLHEGYWTRPPFVIDTPIFPTVEGVGDRVQIGCMNRPLDYWFKKGLVKLIDYGLNVSLYDDFYAAMEKMRDFKKEYGSPDNPKRKKTK